MCGIVGGVAGTRIPSESAINSALNVLRHRGPDASGTYVDGRVFLGHTRLSIIDLDPRANQPMRRDALIISFNGEIYNYRELRKDLKSEGCKFSTESDTEVVLAAFRRYGLGCLKKLEGMFAFSVWDSETRTLTLARDRFGEKPLVLFDNGRDFLFASEVAALEPLVGKAGLAIDPAAIGLYFQFSYIPAPHAPYVNMRQLEPGSWMQMTVDDRMVRSGSYYRPGESAKRTKPMSGFNDAVAELQQRLRTAVSQRIAASDVPVAVFLSGGVDSSVVAMLAADAGPHGLHAYSIAFPGVPAFDESPYARLVAQGLPNVRHTVIDVEEKTLSRFTERTLSLLGEPFADASIIPTSYLCSKVEEKVILGGDGADEIFAGYGVYSAMRTSARMPPWLKRIVAKAPKLKNPAAITNPLIRAAALFRSHLCQTPVEEYASWRTYGTAEDISALGINLSADTPLRRLIGDTPLESLRDIQVVDIAFNMPNDMLKKVDLASMQHGLEVRLPYLDSGLVAFALDLPERYLIRWRERKRILRAAFKHRLPPAILKRRKQGFLLPIRKWFRDGTIRDELADLGRRQTLLNGEILERLIKEHGRGDRDNSVLLWTSYVFLKWQERTVAGA